MSNSKKIKEKVHFYVSGLAGAVHCSHLTKSYFKLKQAQIERRYPQNYNKFQRLGQRKFQILI